HGSPPTREEGLAPWRVGAVGQQSAREVLLAEPGRPAAAEGRGHELGALRAGRVAGVGDHGVSSGLTMRRALRLIFRKAQIAEAVDDELAFHLDMHTQRLIACGMPPDAARREALRQFGDIESVRNDCVTFDEERERTMRRRNYSEELIQDLAYAARTLRRNLGFSLVVVLTLALGIGANTAIFTLIDAVLLRTLDVPHPEQLVAIGNTARVSSMSQGGSRLDILSYPMYKEVRQRTPMFQGLLASGRADRVDLVVDGHEAEHPRTRYVSGNYFAVLGVPAALGRTFGDVEDGAPGVSPVVVISHDYWMRRFSGDRGAIGKKILINDVPLTVVGVASAGFQGEVVGTSYDVWLPITMQPVLMPHQPYLEDWTTSWLLLLGRLKPGATLAQAHAAVSTIVRQAVVDHVSAFKFSPPANVLAAARTDTAWVSSGARGFSRLRSNFHAPLLILMAGVSLLLLIVCANVANLLLARAIARGRGALRAGAGAARVARRSGNDDARARARGRRRLRSHDGTAHARRQAAHRRPGCVVRRSFDGGGVARPQPTRPRGTADGARS